MAANKQFGLIGYPLGHSWSKKYFADKFKHEQIDGCSYSLFPIEDLNELHGLLSEHPNLVGLNVTIPHKETIIALLDDVSDTASDIGAVNTIVIKRMGNEHHLTGHNTDVYGFAKSLEVHQVTNPADPDSGASGAGGHRRAAMVLGTGGASKAVCYVLKHLGWDISLVSRNPASGKHGSYSLLSYQEITHEDMAQHSLIVNTTPLGMAPKVSGYPDIPYKWLTSNHILYDLVYNPETTKFLEFGIMAGCQVIGGLDMLKLQADKSFEIWKLHFFRNFDAQ